MLKIIMFSFIGKFILYIYFNWFNNKFNLSFTSVFKTKEILNILYDNKKIDKKIFDETNEFLEKHKYVPLSEAASSPAKVIFF